MNQDLKEYINKWLEKARHDMETSELIIEMKPLILDVACFHCQQAVEKYLKAFLVFKQVDFERTHNLNLLQVLCSEIENDFKEFDLNTLNEFAVNVRYPDSYLQPGLKETKEYYSMALDIQKLVMSKINFN